VLDGKDIVLLGMRDEVLPIDLTYIDERELELIMQFIHNVAYTELISRSIESMCDWSVRAQNVFKRNRFESIGHILGVTKNQVHCLHGCGYKTRKEVYDVYKSYGLTLPNWEPGEYYDKFNYQFKDERGRTEVVSKLIDRDEEDI
jgi:hypothetical protein